MSAKELQATSVPEGYKPHVIDFFVPLVVLIGLAVGTFIAMGSPKVRWAFGAALLIGSLMALVRGMSLQDLIGGIGEGLKGVVFASVILILAITLGDISKKTGGGLFLVDLLGDSLSPWMLPAILQIISMAISFATGTSWGTFAIVFPLGMPLAWTIGGGLGSPELYLMVCFGAVLGGSVFGDQCSPISDTTILSSMTSGCDLMDHVRTQLVPSLAVAALAAVAWTAVAFIS